MEEKNKLDYKLLFDNMLDGYAYCQMRYDENGKPVDFTYLEVNKAFYELTGLGDVVGKSILEVIPDIKENAELFEIYGEVANGGDPKKFEFYLKPLSIWLLISVFSPKLDYFVAVFENITDQKKIEEELRAKISELERFVKLTVDRELKMKELKKEIEENKKVGG